MKTSFDELKSVSLSKSKKVLTKKVKDMNKNGKNIYKNIRGHENEINYKIYDVPSSLSELKRMVLSVTVVYPGKVNSEFKMTSGHSHSDSEDIYIFLQGKGQMVLNKKRINVKKNDIVSIKKGVWHRVINTGKSKLIFMPIIENVGMKELIRYKK